VVAEMVASQGQPFWAVVRALPEEWRLGLRKGLGYRMVEVKDGVFKPRKIVNVKRY
jgi:hypothetical protein